MLTAISLWLAPLALSAALVPYVPDASTLHLWHLDETATPCADAAAGGTNLTALAGGATVNNASLTNFGTCLSTLDGGQSGTAANQKDAVLSILPLTGTTSDNVLLPLADPTSGAFTFEAIVRVNFEPTLNMATSGRNSSMQILCGEGDVAAERVFQLRLNPVGVGTGNTAVPRLEFINLHQEVSIQNLVAEIPTNGPDAIVSNQWYHVAVTYDGNENTAANLKFYWTLCDSNRSSAALIGSSTMTFDLSTNATCDFTLGNEGRSTGGATDNFVGRIDEVRISSVARGATNFYWLLLDSDADGLADDWELNYFSGLAQGATNDFDLDTFNNLAEFTAGSNPTNVLSTPLNIDADGLPDAWEIANFGSLAQTGSDDPDTDGYTNLQEYNAGTNPNNAAATPADTDADGLPDAWEIANFGNLTQTAVGDADGDGFSNLAEYQGGSNPNSAASQPAGIAVKLVPVEDGNTNTSEFGYAGSSSINTVNFAHTALWTENNQQFLAYYYRHATSATDTNNNRIVIARRTVGTNLWQVFFTLFTANTITDGHDVATFGIDGDGLMHLSWGMHGDAFHYARSTTNVFGTNNIIFGPDTTMTGNENTVTYPQWLRMTNGDLLYLFREGSSGSGDTYLNHYYRSSQTWSNVHVNAGQQPFLKGRTWTPDYNAYPNMPVLDTDGTFHLIWTWRYQGDSPAGESGYQTNHDFDYAHSTNGGLTWLRQNGTPYTLPISQSGENGDTNTVAEKILSIPEGFSLINQAGLCLDTNHSPVIATWWAPGTGTNNAANSWWVPSMGTNNYRRQYMLAFRDANGAWQARQISNRTNDATNSKKDESVVRNLGRPVVVCDTAGRLIVLYRDNQGSNGLTIVYSPPFALDPQRTNWTTIDLTTANLGNYEPVIDQARWDLDNNLHIVYQPSSGEGYTPPANTAAQIAVLEWNAAAYFAHRPVLQLAVSGGTNALLTFNTQLGWSYRVQTSTNLTTWQTLSTLAGNAGPLSFTHMNGIGDSQRYWRLQSQEGGF